MLCEIKKEINISYEGIKEKKPNSNLESNAITIKNKVKLNSNIKNNEVIKKYEILYQNNNILKEENLKLKNEINILTKNKNDLNKELSFLKINMKK